MTGRKDNGNRRMGRYGVKKAKEGELCKKEQEKLFRSIIEEIPKGNDEQAEVFHKMVWPLLTEARESKRKQ